MLTVTALASGLPLVANLEAMGMVARPIAGTPLAALVAASYKDPECAWSTNAEEAGGDPFKRYTVQLESLARNTNEPSAVTGYSEQEITMQELAGPVATAVLAHFNHARTVAAPLVDHFVASLTPSIERILKDDVSGMEVVVSKLPAPMMENSVMSAFAKAKDFAGQTVVFNVAMPQCDEATIISMMKTGSPSADQAIDDWVESLEDGFLSRIYTQVFTKNPEFVQGTPPSTETVFTRDVDGVNAALMTFLIARNNWDKPMDGVEMNLDAYQDAMTMLRDQAALRLNHEVGQSDRNEKYGTLVRSHSRGKIHVNDVVYRKFLSDGGTNEMLFGNSLMPSPALSAKDIMERRPQAEKAWENFLAFNRTTLMNRRFLAAKAAFKMEFDAWVSQASQEELPVNVRDAVMQCFNEELERTVQDETMDLYAWVQRLICRSVFYRTDDEMILSSINRIMKANPEFDAAKAAGVAVLEYTATWVGRQLELVPARA